MPKFVVVKSIAVEVKVGEKTVTKHYMPGAEVELSAEQAEKFGDRITNPRAPVGQVVHVAADGTETPSVPDADGFHTLVSDGPENPEQAEVTAAEQVPEEPREADPKPRGRRS